MQHVSTFCHIYIYRYFFSAAFFQISCKIYFIRNLCLYSKITALIGENENIITIYPLSKEM